MHQPSTKPVRLALLNVRDVILILIPNVLLALMDHLLIMEAVRLAQLAAVHVLIKLLASVAQRDISQRVLLFFHLQDHLSVLNVNRHVMLVLIPK